MSLQDLVLKNRSYRRFDQSQVITTDQLKKWVDLARITPSGANLQPLKYALVSGEEKSAEIFATLKWAGYLPIGMAPLRANVPSRILWFCMIKRWQPTSWETKGYQYKRFYWVL